MTAGLSVGERRQRAREAHSAAVTKRMAAWLTLRDLLGAGHPVMAGLATAMKAAETTDVAADGLAAVADAIARLRADDAELRDDLDLVKLDDACVASMRDVAAKAREAARLAEAKPQELAAAQRALDLQDGRVLHAIGVVTRAFRRARRSDATMLAPELGPLARIFGAGGGRGGSDDDEPDAPTPTPAPDPAPAPNG